ncbi:MAG: hypothetical protein CMJ65_03590 [Planctomycetaceae bacterium]|nr:hypothetical protein [Planctomycetaceae bacterium]
MLRLFLRTVDRQRQHEKHISERRFYPPARVSTTHVDLANRSPMPTPDHCRKGILAFGTTSSPGLPTGDRRQEKRFCATGCWNGTG